jgi:hypothetical protein
MRIVTFYILDVPEMCHGVETAYTSYEAEDK